MGDPPPGRPLLREPLETQLDSWKEIAAYLGRDVTTVQRWEKREGMPIHRHVHDKRGSVYALTAELDAWVHSRSSRSEEGQRARGAETPNLPDRNRSAGTAPATLRWFTLACALLLALLAVAYFVARKGPGSSAPSKIKSLAVLPLKNLSGDPSQEYFADEMTDALIGRLAGIRDLRVISYTSVMRFKNPQLSVPEIAAMLHVDAIVEGSVTREGNRIRVTAQLIRGATDDHFWSETYDRELRDVLGLQSGIAQSIAEKVEATVTGGEHERLAAARAVAPEVYESYLKGWSAFNKGYTRASVEESLANFQDAIKRDPTFAPAYAGLASAYNELTTNFMGAPPEEMRPKVISAARKAIELDPNLIQAHIVLASTLQEEWRWTDAEAEFRRALELSPNDASAHFGLAWWLLCQGRTDDALAWAQRGRELDPLAVSGIGIGWILFNARRYNDAARELRAVLAARPDDASALWYLGFVMVASNRPADAIPVLQKAVSISNRNPSIIAVLIGAYARAGRRNDALRLLAELRRRSKAGYLPAAVFVNAYLGLGENDRAFFWLEQAYEEQSNILQFLKVHPFFDPIRKDPRFAGLLRRVGLA